MIENSGTQYTDHKVKPLALAWILHGNSKSEGLSTLQFCIHIYGNEKQKRGKYWKKTFLIFKGYQFLISWHTAPFLLMVLYLVLLLVKLYYLTSYLLIILQYKKPILD